MVVHHDNTYGIDIEMMMYMIGTPLPIEEIFIYTTVCNYDINCSFNFIILLFFASGILLHYMKIRK